jgi:tyrosine-protein phosphatase YwqE
MKDRTINKWLQQQLIDYISSDSHDTTIRPNQMMSAFEIVSNKYGEEYAARIMGDAGNGSL